MAEEAASGTVETQGLLKAAEVSAMLGFHENTIYRMAEDGRLPCVRFGSTIRFRRADVEALITGKPFDV